MIRSARFALPASVLLVATAPAVAPAAVTWDPTHAPASPVGGAGTWDGTAANWSTGTVDVAWPGGTETAAFGGTTAGGVGLGSDVAALGLQFNRAGYSIDGPNTLTLGTGGLNTGSLTAGAISLNANVALAGHQTWQGNGGATLAGGVTLNVGAVSGTGDLTFAAQGSDARSSRFTVNLNGPSTFAGSTTIDVSATAQMLLTLGTTNALPAGTLLTVNTANKNFSSAIVHLGVHSQTVSGLAATGNETNTQVFGSGTLTVNGSGTHAFSGLIGDKVVLVKSGTGTQILSGANSYQGGTTINGGTLVANHAVGTLGTKVTTINATGMLAGNGVTGVPTGPTSVVGSVTVNAGGTITAGDGATAADAAGKLTTGNQAWKGGGRYAVKFRDNTAGTPNANGTRAGGSAATWDTLAMATLDLRGLSAAAPFSLSLLKVTGGAFTTGVDGEYVLATTSKLQTPAVPSGITQRTDLSALFALDTAALGVAEYHFTVSGVVNGSSGVDLVLSYDAEAAPEPAAVALAALAAWPLLGRRRRV